MIKAVFFDIGNVLLRFDAGKVVRHFAWTVGSHPLKIAKLLLRGDLIDGIERGRVRAKDIYAILKNDFGFDGDFARFRDIWCDQFSLERQTAALLKKTASRKKTFLLSNTHRLHYEYICERYAFPRHVHGAVLSYRIGLRKPEPGIYEAALKRARVLPEESLFIDDLAENVNGARKAGMNAIRYKGTKHLEAQLKAFGVFS